MDLVYIKKKNFKELLDECVFQFDEDITMETLEEYLEKSKTDITFAENSVIYAFSSKILQVI